MRSHIPRRSEETCHLVAEARIVRMLHDSHQLDRVVTYRTTSRQSASPYPTLLRYFLYTFFFIYLFIDIF